MIKKLKQIFSSDFVFYGFLILFIVFIGQLPIILHYFHTPAGYYYPLLDRPSFSDYYYLGLIRYGMGPEWLLKIPYVIYDHQASIIQIFFVVLGKLSLVTGIGPAEIFALFRILGGLLYVLSVVFFLKIILPQSQARIAFVFFLLAQPLPALDFFSRTGSDFDNWVWHFGEAARRISIMPPHYTFGKGLMILSLVFLIHYLKKRSTSGSSTSGNSSTPGVVLRLRHTPGVFPGRGVFAAVLIFIAGIIYPPPVFIVLFSLTIALAFYIFARGPLAVLQGVPFKKLMGISVYLLASILPLILLKLELAKGFPWDGWNKVELGWNTASMQFEWGYIRMLGILVWMPVFYLLSIVARRVSKLSNLGYLRIFILVWFFSSFLLFPFANLLRLGKFRLIEGAQIVPLAILSVWGFTYIGKNKIRTVLFPLFIINFLLFTSLQVRWSTLRLWSYWSNVYIKPEEQEALSFLEKNTKTDSIVLTDTFASNYLPAFVRVRTIIGFPDAYVDSERFRKEEKTIDAILRGVLPENDVRDYLKDKQVDYIYHPIYTYGEKILYPSLLKSIYKNNSTEVFKVVVNELNP